MGAGNPKHVARAAIVGEARGDEQIVGEPVDIGERRRADALARRQRRRWRARRGGRSVRARCSAAGGRRAAGQHEGVERRKLGVEIVDGALQRLDLGRRHAQRARSRRRVGGTQRSAPRSNRSFCARASVASMRARSDRRRRCAGARSAERAVEFVDLAIGGDARIVFAAAARRRRGRCRRRRRCGCRSC